MPSKYIKKTNRSVRSPEDVLEKATKLINEEGFLYRKAADYFGIDKMTLMRFKKKRKPIEIVQLDSLSLKLSRTVLALHSSFFKTNLLLSNPQVLAYQKVILLKT